MTIADEIESAQDHLLDAAPAERGYLSDTFTRVLKATGDMKLWEDCELAALAYARMAAERAYVLGIELGKQAGRMAGAQP